MNCTNSRITGHRPRALAVFMTAVITWSVAHPPAGATVDAPVDMGDVVVVDSNDQRNELTNGDAETAFSLRLPEGSTCPGDSANDQWRIQSFLLPEAENPVAIQYGPVGPEPWDRGDRYAMVMVDSRPFVHQLLRPNAKAGQPGIISAVPAFDFVVIATDQIASGRYRIGLACTYFGATAQYWDTEIKIDTGADVGTLSWRLAAMPAAVDETGRGSNQSPERWLFLAAGAAGVVALGRYAWQRNSRRLNTLSKEPR